MQVTVVPRRCRSRRAAAGGDAGVAGGERVGDLHAAGGVGSGVVDGERVDDRTAGDDVRGDAVLVIESRRCRH